MRMHNLNSKMAESVGYDPYKMRLRVVFRRGRGNRTYEYKKVPDFVFAQLMYDSFGKEMHRTVLKNYDFIRLFVVKPRKNVKKNVVKGKNRGRRR